MRAAAAGLAAFCLCAQATPAAARAPLVKAIWGPTELPAASAPCRDLGRPCSPFPIYRDLGVDIFQFQIHWDEVAPTRPRHPRNPNDPAYRWRPVDLVAREADRYGVGLAAMLTRSPGWANGDRGPVWAPDARDFRDFAVAASRRYPGIRHWMIWGEPTRKENFEPVFPPRGPRFYAEILDRAYAALKRVSRRNVVVGGMTFTAGHVRPPATIRWMRLESGRLPRMDLWGHNPFDERYPRLADSPDGSLRGFNDIDTFHAEIRTAYGPGRQKVPRLWLSEWNPLVPGPRQAARLRAAYTIARRTPYVVALGWFTLLDFKGQGGGTIELGLMDSEGNPKPAYDAYKAIP